METGAGAALGVDLGATLAKLAVRNASGDLDFELFPAAAVAEVAARIQALRPACTGLTGGGAAQLSRVLGGAGQRVNEFAAWGAGARTLLERQGTPLRERHLIVSVGTGTSVMLVDGLSVTRVGGTALGGGTLMGLGALLAGADSFSALTALAAQGSRREVDLLVSDIYRTGEIALAGELTAASFGKLGRAAADGRRPAGPDMAHALMGMVAENVALICAGLAGAAQVSKIVFAGSTLRNNPALSEILCGITRLLGREPSLLIHGEFAGALGALELAASGGGTRES